jgi:ABC-type transport system substrate-binding protein
MTRLLLAMLAIALLALAACSAPLPEAMATATASVTATTAPSRTPGPTATWLPTGTPPPPATATAQPTLTPTPVAGYYRNPDLGFWFRYPENWRLETTGGDLPAVLASDDDDPVRLLAGGRQLAEETQLEEFAQALPSELGLAEEVELLADAPASLADGTPAWEITLEWQDEEGATFRGRGYVAVSRGKGYVVLLYARPEVLATRERTIEAIAGSLRLEQPELFGVARANALVLLAGEPATLDPALVEEGPGGIASHIFSGLVRLNAEMGVEPDLAEEWEVRGEGAVYLFHLRPGVTFHDGRELTAFDVALAWERATDPALASPTAARFLGDIAGVAEKLSGAAQTIAGLRVLNAGALEVTLIGPRPYFLYKLAQPVAFVTPPLGEEPAEEWWRAPRGTGPFTLRRWEPGQALILDRYDHYYGPLPAVDSVVYLLFGEASFLAYEAGEVDVAAVDSLNLARAQDPAAPYAADLVSGATFCTRRVVFDARQAPFDSAAVRQAFSLAVDRQQLAEVVLSGGALPATGLLPPGMPGYLERPAGPAFDPAAAQALLDQAGYPGGEGLPVLTFTAPGSVQPDPLVVALADMWSTHLGVTVVTELLPPAGYEAAIAADHGQLFTFDWCAGYPDPENVLDLTYHSAGPANYGGYANAAVDDLLDQARAEPDAGRRLALYQEAEALLLADAPAVAVVHLQSYVLVRPYVKGFRATPITTLWPASAVIEREEE